jgi:hypothetical protein
MNEISQALYPDLFPGVRHVFHYDQGKKFINPLLSMCIRQDFDPAVIPDPGRQKFPTGVP